MDTESAPRDDWLAWATHLNRVTQGADCTPALEVLRRLIRARGVQLIIDNGHAQPLRFTAGTIAPPAYPSLAVESGDERYSLVLTPDGASGTSPTDPLAKRLLEQLANAFSLRRRHAATVDLLASLQSALERLPIGAIIVEADGRIVLRTQLADHALQRADGLYIRRNGSAERPKDVLAATDARIEADLRMTLRRLVDGTESLDQMVSVPRSGARPFGVLVSRIGRAAPDTMFLVLISDPDAPTQLEPGALQRLYRLTPAESRLCAALASGATLKAYAQAEGVSHETVRSQLKQAMVKTDTHKQAQLVRLLVTGPAAYLS